MSRGRTLGEIADSGDPWPSIRWPCVRTPQRRSRDDAMVPGAARRLVVLRRLVMAGGGGEEQYRRTVLANRLKRAWDLEAHDTPATPQKGASG